MSTYAANEFLVSSNNSMNDNIYNSQKANKSHRIKSILKPLLRMLRKSTGGKRRRGSLDSDYRSQEERCQECGDNSANEELENSLLDELRGCQQDSAIFVADEDGQWRLTPVAQGTCVPVHFARTEAGTFFWTSARPDCDVSPALHCYTECQQPALQTRDRWVQA